MRVYAHIFALVLAASLVAKPCIGLVGAPSPNSTNEVTDVTRYMSTGDDVDCKAKCFKARLEQKNKSQADFARKSSGTNGALRPSSGEAFLFARLHAANPPGWRDAYIPNSRKRLSELCRQLT